LRPIKLGPAPLALQSLLFRLLESQDGVRSSSGRRRSPCKGNCTIRFQRKLLTIKLGPAPLALQSLPQHAVDFAGVAAPESSGPPDSISPTPVRAVVKNYRIVIAHYSPCERCRILVGARPLADSWRESQLWSVPGGGR
jgi:hypothetical protein